MAFFQDIHYHSQLLENKMFLQVLRFILILYSVHSVVFKESILHFVYGSISWYHRFELFTGFKDLNIS